MKSDDVDPSAPPNEKRCTSHLFKRIDNSALCAMINPNSPIELLNAVKDPPAIIFDAVYAGAVLHHFGTQILKDTVCTGWKDHYYPDGITSAADADKKKIKDIRAAKESKKEDDATARTHRRENRRINASSSGPDVFDTLLFLPYAYLPKDDVQAMFRRAQEKAEVAERERLQDVVGQWARDVTGSM
jgi:hypothetical protein